MDDGTLFTIGALAARTGLTVEAIRFYSDKGAWLELVKLVRDSDSAPRCAGSGTGVHLIRACAPRLSVGRRRIGVSEG